MKPHAECYFAVKVKSPIKYTLFLQSLKFYFIFLTNMLPLTFSMNCLLIKYIWSELGQALIIYNYLASRRYYICPTSLRRFHDKQIAGNHRCVHVRAHECFFNEGREKSSTRACASQVRKILATKQLLPFHQYPQWSIFFTRGTTVMDIISVLGTIYISPYLYKFTASFTHSWSSSMIFFLS